MPGSKIRVTSHCQNVRFEVDLRKLRNKVYVRLFSGQSVLTHLLTEVFLFEFKTELSVEEDFRLLKMQLHLLIKPRF